jgi:WD40 repeat protein
MSISISALAQQMDGIKNAPYSNVPITQANAHEVRLLATLSDHLDRVWTVVFSPDGQWLASCGQDGRVLVRNIGSLPASTQMGGFPHWVVGLAFAPDGQYLAYGGAAGFAGTVGPIEVWNVTTNQLERALTGHSAGCWSLDYQEGSGILASGSFDNTVKLWDPQTGLLIRTLYGHTAAVLSVDFNPHQNLLASSGIDYSVRLWDSETGMPVRTLTGHSGNVGYVKFSPDGLSVASSADDGTIRLWNVADGSLIRVINANQGWVNCVNFSADGSLMVSCGHDGSVALREATTGLELNRLEAHLGPVIRGAFNPGGTWLATASWDRTVRLWGIPGDTDSDGVPDDSDNCLFVSNPDQGITITMTGDVNEDHVLTAADIIATVNYIFKSGLLPQPCEAAADVNCDGAVQSADVICLVNHVFRSGPEPCDVCTLPGTWSCP